MASWWHDQASRWPLLSPAQEIHLGQQVRAWLDHPEPVPPAVERRGRRARDAFVRANLRLVCSLVERYRPLAGQHMDDLIQAGNLGLMRGVEKFDPARGYKFSTYAFWWIRQGIHQWLERHSRTIRLPSNHAAQFSRLSAARLALVAELGRQPTRAELAEGAGCSEDLIVRVLERPAVACSLDQPNSRRDDGGLISECIADDGDLWADVIGSNQLEQLLALVDQLPPQAARIVANEYLDPMPRTRAAMAAAEGISRCKLEKILHGSLRQLRAQLTAPPSAPPPAAEPAKPATPGRQLALF